MRVPHDMKYFKRHRAGTTCQRKQETKLANPSISNFFTRMKAPSEDSVLSTPCPGLDREVDFKVKRYLMRTSTAGGGAPSRPVLAKVMFGSRITWATASKKQKRMILRKETELYHWRNNRAVGAVYSTSCAGTVQIKSSDVEPGPCFACERLYSLRTFQVQLCREMPEEANVKYTPKDWLDKDLGTLYLQVHGLRDFVEGVSNALHHSVIENITNSSV